MPERGLRALNDDVGRRRARHGWGWQWYASERGLREYAPGQTRRDAGDVLIEPQTIHRQRFSAEDAQLLETIEIKPVPAS